jgi:chromosome condensin MukBEF ATPase and DNA-binding subunit MukB
MPRPRKYNTNAERTAAYRARMKEKYVEVDREQFEKTSQRLMELHGAIFRARQRGDELAKKVSSGSVETTLDRLIQHFRSIEKAT